MNKKTTLEKIYNSSLKFLAPLSPEETYKTIVHEAIKLVNGQYGSILLEQRGTLKRAYNSYPPIYQFKPRKRGDTYKVYKTNKARIYSMSKIGPVHPELLKTNALSVLMIPLSYQKKAIGVLTILSKPKKKFHSKDLKLLKFFSAFATLAIQRTHSYNETKKALELRDLFISMASHELKTPLTTLNIYRQLIQKKLAKNEPFEPQWIDTVLIEIMRLTRLVNELLQVDLIKTGKLLYSWQQHHFKTIVQVAIDDFKLINKKGIISFNNHLENSPDIILGDQDKILQVITNILNNAVKFSNSHCKIEVDLNKNLNNIILSIKDNGKGINESDIPHVFDRFFRGSIGTHEGMGLGLYLAKQIIEEHKGEINVNSEINKGTVITISLPLYKK